ncbi:MAG: ABC-2 family transporter protein [Anaerolinea sp.]|nr:ABC-2 family transporter protein [Anaerolinea sp.]
MKRLKAELSFLRALTAVNLSSAMEYRASFITQIVGMFINNGIYFVFWLIFFDRFGAVRGYQIGDIYLLFAIVAFGYGIGYMFAANTGANLAYLIAQGRLDYYLVLPRNLLLHVIFSRMSVSTIGDVSFGLVAYLFTGRFHPLEILLFLLTSVSAGLIFVGFGIITGSLAFYIGNAQYLSMQLSNAMLTFALYPNAIFTGVARFLLLTLLPAAFIGAVPVQIIQERDGLLLLAMVGVMVLVWGVATAVFYGGLRRYESGSALNVNV